MADAATITTAVSLRICFKVQPPATWLLLKRSGEVWDRMGIDEAVETWGLVADQRMRVMLRATGMSDHDIDDVVQTVLVEVYGDDAEFASDRQFVAWCLRKANWRAADLWKHQARVFAGDVPEYHHAADVADLVGDERILAEMHDAIEALTPRRRRYVFELGDADAREEAKTILRARFGRIDGLGGLFGVAAWPRLMQAIGRVMPSSPAVRRSAGVAAAAAAVAVAITAAPNPFLRDAPSPPVAAPPTDAIDFVVARPNVSRDLASLAGSPADSAKAPAPTLGRPRTQIKNPLTGAPTGVEVGPEQPGEEGTLICGAQTLVTGPVCLRYPAAVLAITDR